MIIIITLWNKPEYIEQAIQSVVGQTRKDWVHVLQHDHKSLDWGGRYPPAVFWNEKMRAAAPDDYVCWLSDDDLLLPNYVEDLAGYLDAHPQIACCYGGSQVVVLDDEGNTTDAEFLPHGGYKIFSKLWSPGCKIDGGQFMIRRSALDVLEWPWVPEVMSRDPAVPAIALPSRYSDAKFMNKIAYAVSIFPVEKQVMINRRTPLSAHTRIAGGVSIVADWRMGPK